MSSKTAIFTDDLFLEHDTGAGHPENSRRLSAIRNRLEKQSYYNDLVKLDKYVAHVEEIALIHDVEYIQSIKEFCERGGGYLDGDTPVSSKSYDAAMLAAGSGIEAAKQIHNGDISRAILLPRPPGHHSLKNRAMGFCLFNNIAICAKFLQTIGHQKVAILDWDVHHGNGTEEVFYEDPDILFISLHQYPFYPGTGASGDTGSGAGKGTTLNLPMASGADDDDYKKAFQSSVIPELQEFKPEVLLISAGFDAHVNDPLAGIQLSTSAYSWMSERLLGFAGEYCEGRIISFLEGGYDLEALADSVEAHTSIML